VPRDTAGQCKRLQGASRIRQENSSQRWTSDKHHAILPLDSPDEYNEKQTVQWLFSANCVEIYLVCTYNVMLCSCWHYGPLVTGVTVVGAPVCKYWQSGWTNHLAGTQLAEKLQAYTKV